MGYKQKFFFFFLPVDTWRSFVDKTSAFQFVEEEFH